MFFSSLLFFPPTAYCFSKIKAGDLPDSGQANIRNPLRYLIWLNSGKKTPHNHRILNDNCVAKKVFFAYD